MTAPFLSDSELRTILSRGEGQFVEFKSAWDLGSKPAKPLWRRALRDKIADVVAAFANADGGLLLVGVDDDGAVSGHGYSEQDVSAFFEVPRRRLTPTPDCRTARFNLDGHEILAFQVPIAPEAVMIGGNGFPYRVGSLIVREPQEAINERKQAYRHIGYEQRFCPGATLGDLNLDLAESFLRETPVGGRPVREALRYYGLIEADGLDWRVTNAALLLFARRPALRWHPRAGLRVFRVSGTRIEYGRQRNVTQIGRGDPPLASAIVEAKELVRSQIRRSERLRGLFFEDIPEYPEFAWQEALVNAVAHRDYEVRGRETEVWFFDDRLEVSSPGELLPPVTVEALREGAAAHVTRNPMLVRVLADAEIMRDEGEGVARVFREMAASLLREPELDSASGLFRMTLFNEPVSGEMRPGWSHLLSTLLVSDGQRRLLLARPTGFTEQDYQRVNGTGEDESRRGVRDLCAKGIAERQLDAEGAAPTYSIVSALEADARFLEARIPELRAYFDRAAALRNADYRALFGMDRHGALRELRRLVALKVLAGRGAGRGTRYVLAIPPE
ncbi:MAG: putative DNA binding domain-containing protein [Gammaproteobacteria bacterium]|nr:putative DNA binding domain-containing protein [Gammaproteobacteria bacterium]